MSKIMALWIFFLSLAAHAGGWTSSGGGSGIMCFDNMEDAALIRQGARLSDHPEMYSRLTTMMVTDIWENPWNSYSAPNPGETARSYLNRILELRLSVVAPAFYQNLKAALARVDLEKASRSRKALPHLNDTDIITQWEPETKIGPRNLGPDPVRPGARCVVVQIAHRRTFGHGPRARVRLQVDPVLYELLGLGKANDTVLNQAAIQLHEALYLLGSEGGHRTSFQARRLTAVLLSNDKFVNFSEHERLFNKRYPNSINSMGNFIQQELTVTGFGHAAIRGAEKNPRMAAAYRSQSEKRALMFQSQIPDDVDGNAAKISAYFDSLTEEEALFELAQAAIRHGYFLDASSLIDPRAPDHKRAMQIMCRGTRPEAASYDRNPPIATGPSILRASAKVQRLCARLRIR